jgi:hypothetical protein
MAPTGEIPSGPLLFVSTASTDGAKLSMPKPKSVQPRPSRRGEALMAKEAFTAINFQARTLTVIERAIEIISEYSAG